MADYADIKRKLQEMMGGAINQPIQCEVKSVGGLACTVVLDDGMELSDVRLRATLKEDDNQLLITPKKGSKALVWSVDGTLNDLVLIKCDEIEKIEYKQEDLEVVIDSTDKKVTIKNNQASLKSLMQEIHDLITNLKVTTPAGPSTGVLPDTTASLVQFKTHFEGLLND